MNFFHAFLKLTISLLKNKSAQTFLFFIFEKEQKKSRKTLILRELLFPCGETGIRTPGTSRYNGFQDRRNRPLCHLSKTLLRVALFFKGGAKVRKDFCFPNFWKKKSIRIPYFFFSGPF